MRDIDVLKNLFQQVYPLDKDAKISNGPGGYMKVHLPNHPMNWRGHILYHRAVVEENIGRFLYPFEHVHHKDKNRKHNDYKNLKLHVSQRQHMLEEHSNSKIHDLALVELVKKAAADPNVAMSTLPCTSPTVRKICTAHKIEWLRADLCHIDKNEVKRLAGTMSVRKLAIHFGASRNTLVRNFPHLINVRNSPHFLDDYRREILDRVCSGESMTQTAKHFGTNLTTLAKSLHRWSISGDLPKIVVEKLNANPYRKKKYLHKSEVEAERRESQV